MSTRIDAVGLHPLDLSEPCHLIELRFTELDAPFDVGSITQPVPGQPSSNWQTPYLERYFDESATEPVADYGTHPLPSDLWHDGLHIVFFFHYLDSSQPLQTPFGPVTLPCETPIPAHLSEMAADYDAP